MLTWEGVIAEFLGPTQIHLSIVVEVYRLLKVKDERISQSTSIKESRVKDS